MYIVNEHGITHSIPNDWKLPPKARKATPDEIKAYDGAAAVTAAAPAATDAATLTLANTLAEKDLEIESLRAALAAAQKPAGKAK